MRGVGLRSSARAGVGASGARTAAPAQASSRRRFGFAFIGVAYCMAARYPVAIVGPGALGLSFAWRLASRMPVALIARSQERASDLREGVSIRGERFVPEAFG